jgi:F0F1-type ATP synthase gamma subunit
LNTHNYEIRKISIQFNFNLYQSWSDKSRDFAVNTHKFITMYFMSLLSFAFYNAISVENISRNLAMHGASEAAKNNIDELTVHFNKTRQEIITNELNELTVGSKAVKS